MIDGLFARCWYQTDYAEGGHFVVFSWVPKGEIWLEKNCDLREQPYIAVGGYRSLRGYYDARFTGPGKSKYDS